MTISGYDQWKTASPYDDEPDVAFELVNCAAELRRALSEMRRDGLSLERQWLLKRAIDTMEFAADNYDD